MDFSEKYRQELGLDEAYVIKQTELLRKAVDATAKGTSPRLDNLSTLAGEVFSFSRSTVLLSRILSVFEAYVLSRAILDTCINYCYMMVCDQDEYDRFVDFSRRNVIRALETRAKAYEAIGKSISLPDLRAVGPIREVFLRFSSPKKGVDLTRWETAKSLTMEKKLEVIASRVKGFNTDFFQSARLFIYEDASEIAHVTLYGSVLCTGVFWGNKDLDSAVSYAFGIIKTLYLVIGSLIDSVLLVIHTLHPINEFVKESKRNFDALMGA